MKQCTACLKWFAGLHKAGTIMLLKVKDENTINCHVSHTIIIVLTTSHKHRKLL